jgi:hypothetical protein
MLGSHALAWSVYGSPAAGVVTLGTVGARKCDNCEYRVMIFRRRCGRTDVDLRDQRSKARAFYRATRPAPVEIGVAG